MDSMHPEVCMVVAGGQWDESQGKEEQGQSCLAQVFRT